MYTILCRIFIPDIARLIYELNIKSYINYSLTPKLFVINLQMEMLIKKYTQNSSRVSHDLMLDSYGIHKIYKFLLHIYKTLIFKNLYNFKPDVLNTIEKFNTLIKSINEYQTKPLIKTYITKVSRELNQYV